jgi:hypothetical protein
MVLEFRHIKSILGQVWEGYRTSNNGKVPILDVTAYFGIPFIVATTLCWSGISADKSIGTYLTCLAIFVGFLINMLIPFFSIIEKTDIKVQNQQSQNPIDASTRLKQYKILYIQVSFALVLALLTILILLTLNSCPNDIASLLVFQIKGLNVDGGKIIKQLFTFLSYWGMGMVFFSLIQVVVSANALIYSFLTKHTR